MLELKVMADVGLVGFPSVGKSTLLSVVSAAQPKIAAYHFTTLTPNLGVVDVGDGRSFVMADLPGLIEGAHEGVGLGHEFLRHVERTRVVVHIIDMAATDGRDPFDDWQKINNELTLYSAKLGERPQIVVANKMDMPDAEVYLDEFTRQLAEVDPSIRVMPVSAVTKNGVQELLYKVADLLETIPDMPLLEDLVDLSERKVFKFEAQDDEEFTIRRENDTFVIESPSIEKLIKRTNFSTQEAVERFARILRKKGIDQALRTRGAVDGQTIQIGDFEFEFVEKE